MYNERNFIDIEITEKIKTNKYVYNDWINTNYSLLSAVAYEWKNVVGR